MDIAFAKIMEFYNKLNIYPQIVITLQNEFIAANNKNNY
jgi:hypothetical protein